MEDRFMVQGSEASPGLVQCHAQCGRSKPQDAQDLDLPLVYPQCPSCRVLTEESRRQVKIESAVMGQNSL